MLEASIAKPDPGAAYNICDDEAAPPQDVIAFAAVSMLIAMWISLKWMSSIDEAAREAHKWSWFWGGSSGMAVGGMFVILAAMPQAAAVKIPAWYAERTDPAAYAAIIGGAAA